MSRKLSFFSRSKREGHRIQSTSSEPTETPPPEYPDTELVPEFLDVSEEQFGGLDTGVLVPGLVLQPSIQHKPQQVNLTVCTKIILSGLNKSLTEKTCLQLLYMIQQRFMGNRFLLPPIVYSVGKSLCQLESYGQGSFLGKDNSTIAYSLHTDASIHWFATSNMDFDFNSPADNFRVALTYEINPSMFKGVSFPACIPEWMRPVLRASKSYKVESDDTYGFYIR